MFTSWAAVTSVWETTPDHDEEHTMYDNPRPHVRRERMAIAAQHAAELPQLSHEEIAAQADPWHIPPYAGTEILPGLFQGGTEDDDVVHYGRGERYAHHVPYDVIITLYASAQPAPWGVEEFRYGFGDAELRGDDLVRVLRASRLAYHRWVDGDRVLVRCQAGMNRSGLVTAMVLIQAGLSASQAIGLIRARRGPGTLLNGSFVGWLLEHGEEAAARIRWDYPSRPDPLAA